MWPLSLPYALVLAIQGMTLIHILRHGKDRVWIWVVLVFPLVGTLAYLYLEVRVRSLAAINPLSLLAGLESQRIRTLERLMEDCDSVQNRLDLAHLYARTGRPQEGLALIQDHLEGPLRTQPYLLLTYASICTQLGRFADSNGALDKLDAQNANEQRKGRVLLRARNLAELGDRAGAEAGFASLAKGFDGEEARYYHAWYRHRWGDLDGAQALCESGIRTYDRAEPLYRRLERPWYRGLKDLRQRIAQARKAAPPPATAAPAAPAPAASDPAASDPAAPATAATARQG